MIDLDTLRGTLTHPNAQAWLRVIRSGESHDSDARAYMALYGWQVWGNDAGKVLSDFNDHPRVYTTLKDGRKTSAAGAYQITATTWDGLRRRRVGVYTDFSPKLQDLAAWDLTDGRGAMQDVLEGRLASAIVKCREEWTSLPGASESTRTLEQAARIFTAWGGKLASGMVEEQPPAPVEERGTQHVEERQMPEQAQEGPNLAAVGDAVAAVGGMFNPIIPVAWKAISSLLPALAPLAKSEKAQQNMQVATAVVNSVVKATDSVNAEQAIQKLQTDTAMRVKADAAVRKEFAPLLGLVETGGGPEAAATRAGKMVRDADVWWKLVFNPVLIVTAITLPLVYLIVWRLVDYLDKVSPDVISQTIGTVIGLVLGSICGFWMGQTYANTAPKRAEVSQ